MPVQFSFTRSGDGTETIVLLGSQGVRVVPDSHANYETIYENLMDPREVPEADIYAMADAATKVASKLERLSERVMIKGDTIYFDGDPMETRLTKHVVDMIKAGDEHYDGYIRFLENVQANPSAASRESLFRFLEKHSLVITPDGCFVGYKGIGTDGKSLTAGQEDVTVTLADGTVEVHKGHIPNPVGAVIEMPRSLVDGDAGVECSVGLHVANHQFARGFGSKLLTIKVNPRDVVSVPSGDSASKVRVSRYTVLEENTDKTEYTGTSFGYDDYGDWVLPGWDEDEDIDDIEPF
jgi:hypothetical protein